GPVKALSVDELSEPELKRDPAPECRGTHARVTVRAGVERLQLGLEAPARKRGSVYRPRVEQKVTSRSRVLLDPQPWRDRCRKAELRPPGEDLPWEQIGHRAPQKALGTPTVDLLVVGQREAELDNAVVEERDAGLHRVGHADRVRAVQTLREPIAAKPVPEHIVEPAPVGLLAIAAGITEVGSDPGEQKPVQCAADQ